MGMLLQDIRYGLRMLHKNPGFSFAVVLTIAMGIGANTAMFSVIRAVLLRPLKYREPDRIVLITEGATPVRFEEIAGANRSYSQVGAFAGGIENVTLSGADEQEVLKGARVSADFLEILGVSPMHGRGFLAEEDRVGAPAVAMISAELWWRRFGGDASILGKTVLLAGTPHTVIGILPLGFQFPFSGMDVWLTRPSELSVVPAQARPLSPTLTVFGRLKRQISIQEATTELAVINRRYASAHPGMLDAKPGTRGRVHLLKDVLVANVRLKLWMLSGAVAFVLLIACANIASLLLARAASRSREFAVRAAIGAGRKQIIAQLLIEAILLAAIGGALGTTLAAASLRTIKTITFIDLPRSGEIRIDAVVLGFAVVLSVITGVMFGLVPSWQASKADLNAVLRGTGEAPFVARARSTLRLSSRSLLVAGQVALSIVLLIGATLLLRSLVQLYRVDLGFQTSNLLTMKIGLSPTRYDTNDKKAAFYDEVVRRTESLPGIRSAAISLTLPTTGFARTPVQLTDRSLAKLNERPLAIVQDVTPEYFRTLEIAFQRGREFTAQDNKNSSPVVIINESLARLFWPQYSHGPDPIGQHILVGSSGQPVEIIGVSADIRQGKDQDPRPGVYLPCSQKPPQSAMLAVRTDTDPLSFANAVRTQISAIDPDQPVSAIASMDELVEASEGQLRLMTRLLEIFASVATLLTVAGLYSVISYSVVQRAREIGIRRALGAPQRDIVSLVISQAMGLALSGIVLGIGGALALTRVLRGLLFQVSATDPLAFVGISLLFGIVALAAGYIPARRATKIDPMVALRYE